MQVDLNSVKWYPETGWSVYVTIPCKTCNFHLLEELLICLEGMVFEGPMDNEEPPKEKELPRFVDRTPFITPNDELGTQ